MFIRVAKHPSLLAGTICICALNGTTKNGRNISLLAGKLSLEKKVCSFEWCLVLNKNIRSLLAGKIVPYATDLSHQNSKYMFDFWLDSVQNRRIFFLLGNPP